MRSPPLPAAAATNRSNRSAPIIPSPLPLLALVPLLLRRRPSCPPLYLCSTAIRGLWALPRAAALGAALPPWGLSLSSLLLLLLLLLLPSAP